jgi:hypothetical protein
MKRKFINPEIKEYRVRTESMIAASKPIVDITPDDPTGDTKPWYQGLLSNYCTKDGVASGLPIGDYNCFRANKENDAGCELFNLLNAKRGDIVKVTRINETIYRAEIVDELCIGGTNTDYLDL